MPELHTTPVAQTRVIPLVLLVAWASAACGGSMGHLEAVQSETWVRTYSIAPNGEFVLVNGNGLVDVEGVDGSTLEVRAEKIVRGATEQIARDLLPKITIKERATPESVTVESESIPGILLGASYEVRYHVKTPRTVSVRATTTNGRLRAANLAGQLVAQTSNGPIVASHLSGGFQGMTTNGPIGVQLDRLGADRVTARTTNGRVTLALPDTAKANLVASLVNGRINNMVYGSYAPGAPDVFIDDAQWRSLWLAPERYYLVASQEEIARFEKLVGRDQLIVIKATGGKVAFTNHPL